MTFDSTAIGSFDTQILSLQGQMEQAKSESFQQEISGKVAMLKGNISQACSHFGKASDSSSVVSSLKSEMAAVAANRVAAEKEALAAEEKADEKKLDPKLETEKKVIAPVAVVDPKLAAVLSADKDKANGSGLKYLNPAD